MLYSRPPSAESSPFPPFFLGRDTPASYEEEEGITGEKRLGVSKYDAQRSTGLGLLVLFVTETRLCKSFSENIDASYYTAFSSGYVLLQKNSSRKS